MNEYEYIDLMEAAEAFQRRGLDEPWARAVRRAATSLRDRLLDAEQALAVMQARAEDAEAALERWKVVYQPVEPCACGDPSIEGWAHRSHECLPIGRA